jgi:hypothetical protein
MKTVLHGKTSYTIRMFNPQFDCYMNILFYIVYHRVKGRIISAVKGRTKLSSQVNIFSNNAMSRAQITVRILNKKKQTIP